MSRYCCNLCNRCRNQRKDAQRFAMEDDEIEEEENNKKKNLERDRERDRQRDTNTMKFNNDNLGRASTRIGNGTRTGTGRASEINADLDLKITRWQNAISESERLERVFYEFEEERDRDGQTETLTQSQIDSERERQREGRRAKIEAVRKAPSDFLSDSDDRVRAIAIKRLEVVRFQDRLGLDVDVDADYSLKERATTAVKSKSTGNNELQWVAESAGGIAGTAGALAGGVGGFVSQTLSSVWSKRLNNVNLLQDDFQLGRVDASVTVKPKWPSYLQDVTYDIVKVNKYGQHLTRILKLTQFHVISIKNGEQVTKFFRYSDIKRLWLQNGNIIKVIQRNEKRNMYMSPIAPHILQQIITRVQVRNALDNTDFHGDIQGLGYTMDNTAEMIKAISEDSAIASEEVFFNFANELKSKVLFATEGSNSRPQSRQNSTSYQDGDAIVNAMHMPLEEIAAGVALPTVSHAVDDMEEITSVIEDIIDAIENLSSVNEVVVVPPPPPSSPVSSSTSPATNRKPIQNQRFLVFAEGTPEHKLQSMVRNIVSDPNTAEGNTLKLFIQSFLRDDFGSSVDNRLLKLRNFIDGLHEHVVTTRGYKLAVNFQQEKQKSLIFKNRPSAPLRRASLNIQGNLDVRDIDEDVLTFISFVVFVVVEETAFLPLKDRIVHLLREEKGYGDESLIIEKAAKFSKRTQVAWSIPDLLVSPLGWKTAIFELSQLENNLTPTHQLLTLTRTVKAVYNEFKVAILPELTAKGYKDVLIAADDLVPIFLYILAHTNLRHPLQNRDLMWALCHPDQLRGEGGYYLTVYESALEFITHETMDDELANRNSVWMTRSEHSHSRSLSFRTSSAGSNNPRNSNLLATIIRFPTGSYYDDQQDLMTMRESFA